MASVINKEEAHRMIDELPANATWEDLAYEIYVLKKIHDGQTDIVDGKTYSQQQAKERLATWLDH